MIKFLKWMSILPLVLLAGCPAPSDSAKNNQAGGGALEPGVNLIMSISSSGEINNKIPTNDDASVEMIFLDAAERPLSDRIINVSATSGTLSQTSVLTDQEGKATVTINPPTLTTGTAPGLFTATPQPETDSDTGGETGVNEILEEETALIEKVNQPVRMNYEFVATTVAETPDEAATFVSSLQFISATPTFLSLKGTGGVGYGEISNLIFRVVDNENNPIEGVEVNFTLTTTVGGLALSAENSLTNNEGMVFVNVLAGTIATPVRVTASVSTTDGSLLSVQSDQLTITTGIPDQNSFSLSLDKFAPEAADFDGDTVGVTVRLSDRNNNPVPDKTVINFTTEGGSIEGSCETQDGACSVTWTGQNPRPSDHRSTILAYTIGHETYYDENGSGIFDDGDAFDDLGETFRDDDEMGTYNPGEIIFSRDEKLIDYDEDGAYTPADAVFNGVPCNHSTDCPADANNIAGRSNLLTNVSGSGVIIMAASVPNVHLYELLAGNSSCLDGNNKLSITPAGTQCQPVDPLFGVGTDIKTFWVLIEDTKTLCLDGPPLNNIIANGSRIISGVTDPNSPACTYPVRQSAPTGSSISVSSEVGELSGFIPDVIGNTNKAITFTFVVASSPDNVESDEGFLVVEVVSPLSEEGLAQVRGLVDPPN